MRLAANALRCARTSETFVDDEWCSRGGEAISVEADAAVMGAAPSGVDRAERAREPAQLSRTSASRFCVTFLRHARRAVPTSGGAVLPSDDEAISAEAAATVMSAAPVGADRVARTTVNNARPGLR